MEISQETIDTLNERQKDITRHPYTCCGGSSNTPDCKRNLSYEARRKGETVEYTRDNEGVLIATKEGWVCPCGDYKQEIR